MTLNGDCIHYADAVGLLWEGKDNTFSFGIEYLEHLLLRIIDCYMLLVHYSMLDLAH